MAQEGTGGQEKTEEPTARRLQEARKKGDVAKSMEIPSAAVLLAGLLTLYAFSDYFLGRFSITLKYYLGNIHTLDITMNNMPIMTREGMTHVVMMTAPVMAVIMLVALAANYAQVGVIFSTEKLKPQLSKISPLEGIKKLFSIQSMAQTFKSIAKLALVGFVAYREVFNSLPAFPSLMDKEVFQIMLFMSKIAFWIFLKAAIIIAILAALDYVFQKWQFTKKMKMTKQEVKEEAKQTEGDPMVKGRIRSIQMEMARKRMMAEVPEADVVITNPTRLAIAIKYDPTTMTAPTVIAKGAGLIAKRIKEIAQKSGIPIVEDKPLARLLYKTVELNQVIPENLFQAVAEVLAYVYGLKNRRSA